MKMKYAIVRFASESAETSLWTDSGLLSVSIKIFETKRKKKKKKQKKKQ